jgi:hypothetical protein
MRVPFVQIGPAELAVLCAVANLHPIGELTRALLLREVLLM